MASAAYDIVKERLDGGEVVLLDGAISTEIEKRGVPMDELVWSGLGKQDRQRDPARSAQRLYPCGGRRDYNKHVLLGETQPDCWPDTGELPPGR